MENTKEKRVSYQWQSWLLLFVVGGIYGFIYEEIFYRIDLGYFVKRGTTFGPWIPIYGFGALIIIWSIKKIKDKPILVFAASVVVSGIIEFVSGYVLYNSFHLRLWDYNIEIWNWLNIGGYVCLRSVLFFGVSACLFQYAIIPLLEKIVKNSSKIFVNITAVVFAALFMGDILVSLIVKGA